MRRQHSNAVTISGRTVTASSDTQESLQRVDRPFSQVQSTRHTQSPKKSVARGLVPRSITANACCEQWVVKP